MYWLRRIKNVLDNENELWLAYLYGQQYDNLKHLSESGRKYKGTFARFSIWLFLLIKQTRFRFNPRKKKCTFLIYAGTVNQKNALEKTVQALKNKGQKICCVAPKKILSEADLSSKTYTFKTYSILDVFKSLLIVALRYNYLRKQLEDKNKNLLKNDFNVFLNVYSELVYFEKLLKIAEPEYVVVSNDHNESNRALLALARNERIKTLYMQHASVSNLFPSINVDYAFLDGESALNTYRKCEKNIINEKVRLKNRQAFLTGQKKKLRKELEKNKDKVGVAINSLDPIGKVKTLVQQLCLAGVEVKLRWHPAFSKRKVRELLTQMEGYKVHFSDPVKDPLTSFFSDLICLIAGNSSIHLEAALSGVIPIYYEIIPSDIPDYYGYVDTGLAKKYSSLNELTEALKNLTKLEKTINKKAVQFYSATYLTDWEGREGELVAEIMEKLSKRQPLPIEPVCFLGLNRTNKP